MSTAFFQLRGIVPPMVTPLCGPDTLDNAGLERLIEHILAGGVHGLFILGTTGEAPGLSTALRRELIERTCRLIGHRVPVLVGISDTSAAESLALARFAEFQGASALVLAPPFYYPNSQEEMREYLEHLCPQLPLPVFLYNMPTHTKTFLEVATVRHALELPNVVGIKDSSGNMLYFHRLVRLLREYPEHSLLIGPEELLGEAILFGGHGGVSGGANLCPRLYVDLYEAAIKGEVESVHQLHDQVMEISETLYQVGHHSSSFIKGVKCSLSLLGICDDFMVEPFHRFRTSERNVIQSHLETLDIRTNNSRSMLTPKAD